MSYAIFDLGPDVRPLQVNARGQACGFNESAGQDQGFFWSSAAGLTLIAPSSYLSWAQAINASGQIALTHVADKNLNSLLYRWTPPAGGTASRLELLRNPPSSVPLGLQAINNQGHCAGYSFHLDRCFLWVDPDVPVQLSSFEWVQGMNAFGQIAGNGGPSARAALWQPDAPNSTSGEVHSIDLPPGATWGEVHAINASGHIVGTAGGFPKIQGVWEHGQRAFLWTPSAPNSTSGSAVELGALPKDWYPLVLSESEAYGINGRGAVVGTSNGRAFVYRNGRMDDLNDFIPPGSGWILIRAEGISDSGWIVGFGTFAGEYHGFVLRPPLPWEQAVNPPPPPPWTRPVSPSPDDTRWRAFGAIWQILRGERDDSPGFAIPLGPPPPHAATSNPGAGPAAIAEAWSAWVRSLSPRARDALIAIATSEVARSLGDAVSREELTGAALEAAARAIDQMRRELRARS